MRIAIVGIGCRYPDAAGPEQLWENVVAGRRAFRQIPGERLNLDDYWSPDPTTPDRMYARTAAVLKDYEFDRVRFRTAGSTYRSTDLTHWLALDVAAQALADAGFPDGRGLPAERTAVIVGNTLTGEFSRANVLRLRWPYVRRVVAAALRDSTDWDDLRLAGFLDRLEADYKHPFPPPDEDTLAGALANTIAGRICNHFDLGGGGYTVDGACSSSLLSVATACDRLTDGDVDMALAGGVDLSIDAFELVGFAKTGALARREMRVYDRGSNGFWPGEGCGMVVLMREADALDQGRRVYATVAGWGISSDGRGGITRPEADGYRRALDRAYRRAGFGIETVALFEGHGTGTAVGDATELRALTAARRAAAAAEPAAIGTIKAMIGHTKAAAGVAGLIKATLAVHHGTIPPTVGCIDPDPQLTEEGAALRAPRSAEDWPAWAPRRAGVTSMGFGGINTHVAVEAAGMPAARPATRHRVLARGLQDAELLLLDAPGLSQLHAAAARLRSEVARLSYAELGDLAAVLRASLTGARRRAAVVVRSPQDAVAKLDALLAALDEGRLDAVEPVAGYFLGHADGAGGRLGLLFPGQGSGRGTTGGALRRRFPVAEEVYRQAVLPTGRDAVATEVAQPRIVAGSLAGLRVLANLGLSARVALGHSLGELSALHWAGALDEAALVRIAAHRGAVMGRVSTPGTMVGLATGADTAQALIGGEPVVIAGLNGPGQTVVAGPADAVERVCAAAERTGIRHARLAVSHAFHSPLMAPAADAFGAWLADQPFAAPTKRVISTVTGRPLSADADLRSVLRAQITEPVRFAGAVSVAAAEVDLFIEVGPGRVLSRMVPDVCDVPAVALDTDDESLASLLCVLAAAYVRGAPPPASEFFNERLVRPLDLDAPVSFLANPCEAAPQPVLPDLATLAEPAVQGPEPGDAGVASGREALAVLRTLVADRAELPEEVLSDDSRLLDDLHLSSITVGQLVNRAARELGLDAVAAPANFATATVRELATALEELAGSTGPDRVPATVEGVAAWVRPFVVDLIESPCAAAGGSEPDGRWEVHAPPADRFADRLRAALEQGGVGDGVLVYVPARPGHDDLERALLGIQAAARQRTPGRLVLVQAPGTAAGALARTARLEYPQLRTTVVTVEPGDDAILRVVADVAATTGFAETVHHAGTRYMPVVRLLSVDDGPDDGGTRLGSDDVLLVTGGGKGITAECALALTTGTGAALVLFGRSDPTADAELAANLARIEAAGLRARYMRVNVTDRTAVRSAVAQAQAELGPVTAVLHGAGRNEPTPLAELDGAALRRTLAPKVDGLEHVLSAVDGERLRLLVTFGSIIGRAGLPGEAHYALANEQLAELTRAVGAARPNCRTLCLEWSVWSGVGMGERLSVVESLLRAGVTPISADDGVRMLRRLLCRPGVPPIVVVSGRTGQADTVRYHEPELPLLRFLERTLVHYHDVELVTEVTLTPTTDPYLDDHRLDGERVFPAVLGLEAMTQVASALVGGADTPRMEQVEFARPIVVGDDGTIVRIAALQTAPGVVDVVIRCAESGFRADHFRATVRFDAAAAHSAVKPAHVGGAQPTLLPSRDLYGSVLFQDGRFRRVMRYRRVAARYAEAEVAATDRPDWFSAFLPGRLLLGDPGARDAFLHAIQVCVPGTALIPSGVDAITAAGPKLALAGPVVVTARERSHTGTTYVYDLAVCDSSGAVVEHWSGLRLRALGGRVSAPRLVPDLLGPYLQRRLEETLAVDVAVAVAARRGSRRDGETAGLLAVALDRSVEVRYRPDGRPLVDGWEVSAAYAPTVGLAVAATVPVACDVEPVVARSAEDWRDLLGAHAGLADRLSVEVGEPWDTAATRVWCAMECVQKAGRFTGPLTVRSGGSDGWVSLDGGGARIETYRAALADVTEPLVLAVLTEKG
ncbi:type I polyketide synthase [Micromonospora sp. NPDC003776]